MTALDRIPRVARALGDRTRVRILAALSVRGLCVCELTSILGVEQSVVSRHLGILRGAGFVEDVRDGRWVEYRLATPEGDGFDAAALRAVAATVRSDPGAKDLARRATEADRRTIPAVVQLRVPQTPPSGADGGIPWESASKSSAPAAGSASSPRKSRRSGSRRAASPAKS